jgi:hypothetical protein
MIIDILVLLSHTISRFLCSHKNKRLVYAIASPSFLKRCIALLNASIVPSYIIPWSRNVPVEIAIFLIQEENTSELEPAVLNPQTLVQIPISSNPFCPCADARFFQFSGSREWPLLFQLKFDISSISHLLLSVFSHFPINFIYYLAYLAL